MAGCYAVWHGPEGLTRIARRVNLHGPPAGRRRRPRRLGTTPRRRSSTPSPSRPATVPMRIMAAALDAGFNLRRRGRNRHRHRAGRDRHHGRAGGAVRRAGRHPRTTRRLSIPPSLLRAVAVPDGAGVLRPSRRARHAALPQAAGGSRHGAQPLDDPARLLHDEAERHRRDDAGDLARLRRRSIRSRPDEPDRGVPRPDRPACRLARDADRVRRRVVAAECRQPGRVCRPAGDPRLSRSTRRGGARCLPDPVLRPRHQPGERRHGRAARGGGRLRRRGQCRSGRSARQGRASTKQSWRR